MTHSIGDQLDINSSKIYDDTFTDIDGRIVYYYDDNTIFSLDDDGFILDIIID